MKRGIYFSIYSLNDMTFEEIKLEMSIVFFNPATGINTKFSRSFISQPLVLNKNKRKYFSLHVIEDKNEEYDTITKKDNNFIVEKFLEQDYSILHIKTFDGEIYTYPLFFDLIYDIKLWDKIVKSRWYFIDKIYLPKFLKNYIWRKFIVSKTKKKIWKDMRKIYNSHNNLN